MFDENFSFTVRSGSLDSTNSTTSSDPSRSVSPCSPINAFPPPQYTVTDLAACFGRSRLRQDAQMCYDSCDAYANLEDDAGWKLDPVMPSIETESRKLPRVRSGGAACTASSSLYNNHRTRRQSNSRLLCSTTHHRDIAALVARMVENQEQCAVSAPADILTVAAPPPIIVAAADDDEGYDSSDYFDHVARSRQSSVAAQRIRLEYRRSSDLKSTGASVNKAIRLRKDRVHKRRGEA